ncbi:hypothetical protein JCM14635_26160 [Megalodesulfovibrio paquesii]
MTASSRLLLDAGSGGRASQRLVADLFLKHFDNPVLAVMDDAARLQLSGPVAMSTDGFIVDPIIFPGGNIGSLAVHGTVNDVAMLGARPRYLTAGFILEEGLEMDVLETIVAAMGQAAREAGVQIVAGDTKVAPRARWTRSSSPPRASAKSWWTPPPLAIAPGPATWCCFPGPWATMAWPSSPPARGWPLRRPSSVTAPP